MNFENIYQKLGVPMPTLSYTERHIKRLAWRNERNLHRRKCALSGREVLSVYGKDAQFPVYSQESWYGDAWNPLEYGQDYDFNRPFFEQFYELQSKVPRIANILANTENCDYCNIVGDSKNCYLLFGSVNCEDCLYGSPFNCRNCIDSLLLYNSELCYECIDSDKLYECFFCQDCYNSRNLYFCFDMQGCQDCFLSAGLRKRQYCIYNKQYSKEDYEKEKLRLMSFGYEKLEEALMELKKQIAHKHMEGTNNENVVGDHVSNSKNCYYLYNGENCEDVSYSTQILDSNNCLDCDYGEKGSFNYETSGFYKANNIYLSHWIWEASNLCYSSICTLNTRDCFGSISLKHKQYCILNKQYEKEDYETLLLKIIQHMKGTGEWGEFFPMKYSPFPYEETVAQEYFPRESYNKIYTQNTENISDTINCKVSGRLFKLMPMELAFYKRYKLRLPDLHPDERHKRRLNKRQPRKLWKRNCSGCEAEIVTSYSPESSERVYCENCYLKESY